MRIKAAVIDLAANAPAAMQGGGLVTMRARACPAELGQGPVVATTVADTGAGMSRGAGARR